MKTITNRTEIAKALNFGKYPVLVIDKANTITLGDEVCGYRGSKVRVAWNYQGETYYSQCELNWYGDTKKLSITQGCVCISNSFGSSDILEMVEYANAPILDRDMEFVLIVKDSRSGSVAYPILMRTSNYKNLNCTSVLVIDETIQL